jgi:hypothetical protein
MDADSTAKLLDAATKLLGVLVWPAVIAYIFIRFGPKVGDFISSLGEITLKGAGFEASAKRRQNEAAAALVAASASRPEAGATPEAVGNAAKEAVQLVGELSVRNLRRIEDSRILWVDDNPDNIFMRGKLWRPSGCGLCSRHQLTTRSIRSEIRNSTLSFPIWEGLLTARRATPFSTHCGRREIVHHSLSTLGLAPLNIKPSQDAEAQ